MQGRNGHRLRVGGWGVLHEVQQGRLVILVIGIGPRGDTYYMKVQIIERDGQPEWAVLPYAEYLALLDRLEDIEDQRAFDQARAELAADDEELVPADVVARLSAGESPLKVWREHRGLTQQALADAAGVGKSYLSQLEAGARTGSVRVLRALAQALDLDLDDLTPWRQD